MVYVKVSVMWEGEQVVSGQEKVGFLLFGKGLEKEYGFWEGRLGIKTVFWFCKN